MWRFGQRREVVVDIVATEGSKGTLANLERKAAEADRMFSALVEHSQDAVRVQRSAVYQEIVEVPAWLS
jgi:hypothetical protein